MGALTAADRERIRSAIGVAEGVPERIAEGETVEGLQRTIAELEAALADIERTIADAERDLYGGTFAWIVPAVLAEMVYLLRALMDRRDEALVARLRYTRGLLVILRSAEEHPDAGKRRRDFPTGGRWN